MFTYHHLLNSWTFEKSLFPDILEDCRELIKVWWRKLNRVENFKSDLYDEFKKQYGQIMKKDQTRGKKDEFKKHYDQNS